MKTEAFAIVQIEAMSCAKPIISTHIPGSGVSWVNAHEASGLIVAIEDSQALADAIRNISGNDEQYTELSAGSLSRYQQLFTRNRMIDRCLCLYGQILGMNERNEQP